MSNLPYDGNTRGLLCFEINDGGGLDGPFIRPTCADANCVFINMPDGTKFRVLQRPVPDAGAPLSSIQLTDSSDGNRLGVERGVYPTLWARRDSDADLEDLSTYTELVTYGREELLAGEAQERVDVVLLVSPDNQPLLARELPPLARRS